MTLNTTNTANACWSVTTAPHMHNTDSTHLTRSINVNTLLQQQHSYLLLRGPMQSI
jgi:hypothetical protein